ncbi:hypothetical protein AE928_19960, partial [Xanthomonas arboricola]
MVPHMSATADDLKQFSKSTLRKTLGQFGQQRNNLIIPIGTTLIAHRRARHANHRTGPALAPAMLLDEPGQKRALVRRVYSFFAMTSFNAWFSIASS